MYQLAGAVRPNKSIHAGDIGANLPFVLTICDRFRKLSGPLLVTGELNESD